MMMMMMRGVWWHRKGLATIVGRHRGVHRMGLGRVRERLGGGAVGITISCLRLRVVTAGVVD